MTFELSEIALQEEATVHLTNPKTGALIYADVAQTQPVQIVVRGTASAAYRRAVDAMLKKAAKRGKREPTSDEIREQSVEFLVALSVRGDNITYKGEELNSPEVFRKLYADDSLSFIRDQINEAIGSVDLFLKD
jgi:hypothetical protein